VAEADAPRRGLLVDFGGVLTTDVFAAFQAFCESEGLEPDAIRDAFMRDDTARSLLFELELGTLPEAEFEPRFAAAIGVADHELLIERLFAGMRPEEAMVEAVAAARRAGVRTGLVSNSWGAGTKYDRSRFEELFDGVVISSDEGLRKPDPAIYALGASRIGLPPEACVFVDDLPGNLKPARAMGMATVRHVDAQQTIAELQELLGVSLTG
jgi:epoxide hydrolase-like predicted phosphatase